MKSNLVITAVMAAMGEAFGMPKHLKDPAFRGHVTTTLANFIQQIIDAGEGHPREIANKLFARVYRQWKELREMPAGANRARVFHTRIDAAIDRFKKSNPADFSRISCGLCSGCCHTQVDITEDEAKLLAERIMGGVEIDHDRLRMQAQVPAGADQWGKLNFQERACVFLSKEGRCTVYEDRPASCRKWFQIGDPKGCDDYWGSGWIQSIPEAELITSGAFNLQPDPDRLPTLLLRELEG